MPQNIVNNNPIYWQFDLFKKFLLSEQVNVELVGNISDDYKLSLSWVQHKISYLPHNHKKIYESLNQQNIFLCHNPLTSDFPPDDFFIYQ